jgi:hypothetical protein
MQLFVRGLQGGWSSVLSLQGSDTVADLKAAVEVSSMHFCYLAALVRVHAATVLLLLLLLLLALLADACVTQLLPGTMQHLVLRLQCGASCTSVKAALPFSSRRAFCSCTAELPRSAC